MGAASNGSLRRSSTVVAALVSAFPSTVHMPSCHHTIPALQALYSAVYYSAILSGVYSTVVL